MPNISDVNHEDITEDSSDEVSIKIEQIPEISEDTIYNILFRKELDEKL